MANSLFCMGCMQPISEFSDNCYHCGYPAAGQNPTGYLPVRTVLSERYVVGRALEKRNDAIVYIGYDKTARNVVLVREFFPAGLCERLSRQVVASGDNEQAFRTCFEAFQRQARIIARMRELPAMIPVYDIFEENGTVYTVSDHVDGMPLRRHVQAVGGHMTWEAARPLFVPLINSLISLHAAGLFHLGISPDSIIYDSNKRLRIDGWQLADVRNEGGLLKTKRPVGYAAPEQYRTGGVESSHAADVYAIAATMLYVLTGEEPPSAVDRMNKVASLQVPADVAEKWPAHIAPTLCEALALDVNNRIRTAELFRDRLTIAPVVEALKEDVAAEEAAPSEKDPKSASASGHKGLKAALIVMIVLCVLLTAGIGAIFAFGHPFAAQTPAEDTTPVVQEEPDATEPTLANPCQTPSVYGLTARDVTGKAYDNGITVQVVGTVYSDQPVGTIVKQEPDAGEIVEQGTVVSAYISAGTAQSTMIDLTGVNINVAKMLLQFRGYTVEPVYLDVATVKADCVDHTVPAAGEEIAVGDEVVLYVSSVDPPVQIGGQP